ncbi:MAG: hypothetical protein IIT33_09075, partial [Prevotella sp.]|nr:hypothetical protein [Prevotella sp.]
RFFFVPLRHSYLSKQTERMVHFKPKIQNSWGKSFLTSVLGTTISILLTFDMTRTRYLSKREMNNHALADAEACA